MKSPSDHQVSQVETVLHDRFGLDRETLGSDSVRQVLRRRMEIDPAGGRAYIERLAAGEAELDDFVEELLVPETWFFRDNEPFRCLRHFMAGRRRRGLLTQKVRVLSVPCSTGEESYSIAMTLLDLGFLPSQFQVDGVDLSRLALATAAEARYRNSSLRGDDREFSGLLQGYLLSRGDRHEVKEEVRAAVRFRQANLVSANFLLGEPAYQVIFCRNVLIYFHADARRTALSHLRRLLAPEGLLYVGHVEAAIVADGPFRSLDKEFPFAFSPADELSTCQGTGPPLGGGPAAAIAAGKSSTSVRSPQKPSPDTLKTAQRATESTSPPEHAPEQDLLKRARQAADSGRLDQATAICEQVLADRPAHADAFCLLGLIHQARGALPEAKGYFQKALYLCPRHHEALVHMTLLAQQSGNERAAGNYRRRAEQVPEHGRVIREDR